MAGRGLDKGRLSVRQTLSAPRNPDTGQHVPVFREPKTRRGRRSVPLPAATVAALRAHKTAQKRERMMVGPGWTDHGLVFCEPDGQPINPDRFRKRFEIRVARSELPLIRFHDLRHTCATLALQAGIHAKVVSEILGHASIGITLDTYSHAVPGAPGAGGRDSRGPGVQRLCESPVAVLGDCVRLRRPAPGMTHNGSGAHSCLGDELSAVVPAST